MIETTEPMSYKFMEKVLKHLPEPMEVEVTLYNFDYSNVHKQANEISKTLEFELDNIGYIGIEAKMKDPSKEKILRLYKFERERGDRLYKLNTGEDIEKIVNEEDLRFISFKKAEWNLKNLRINLDSFSVLVKCASDIPDYINKMREELKDTFVDYKIEQIPTLY